MKRAMRSAYTASASRWSACAAPGTRTSSFSAAGVPSAALGLGVDLSRRSRAPLSVFLRCTAFGQAPVNDGVVLHLAAQLGVAIHFDR